LQSRRQRRRVAIGGQLALTGVHRQLRADGDGTDTVAPRDEVALDLDVAQNLVERSVVARQQRIVDLTALVGEAAAKHPVRRRITRFRLGVELLEELRAGVAR
jgi:hypothetical protein